MKNFFVALWQRKLMVIIIIALFGIFVVGKNYYDNQNSNYTINFKYEDGYHLTNLDDITSYDNILFTKNDINRVREEKYIATNTYPYSSFSYVKVKALSKDNIKVVDKGEYYQIQVKLKYFESWQQARRFMANLVNLEEVTGTTSVALFETADGYKDISKLSQVIVSYNEFVPYKNLWLGILIGFIVSGITIGSMYFILKDKMIDKVNYDNENIYKYPTKLSYWKKSLKIFKSPKDLMIISMLFAMMQVSKLIHLPSGFGSLNISLGPIFFAIIACLYGPWAGLLIGMISDIFGFFVFPTGQAFHPGYTLNAMLAGLTWALCFYKSKITFSKILLGRIVVNIFVNSYLGSIWWGQVMKLTPAARKSYMLITALPKNIFYLIPQSIVLYLVFKAILPVFKHNNLLEPEICDNITIF